ncbi:putative baseplate assembly protein (plasmid) [Kitasatospora sp. NBC_00070]|uniref:putative baseplate assembly protein n=1 Tax=Kitasatospora sp. NBC_00070 TaxID=2975962 RepID=UPI002F918FEC
MSLPAPNLDDRRFQELVDDAKRLVMQRCPEWTDHNVSDPGITLIETFAYMTDQLLYRLNRVPDRLYIKFLELIGVRLIPPTPAHVPVTFWLSAPSPNPIGIPSGTRTATMRTDREDAIVFATTGDLMLIPAVLQTLLTAVDGAEPLRPVKNIEHFDRFPVFSPVPRPGDALLLGLASPVPNCAVRLDLVCEIEGVGVDPTRPPLRWEAWTGEGWDPCEVSKDETGGLNRGGTVMLHIPAGHTAHVIDGQRGGWLRAVVTEVEPGQPSYSSSPILQDLHACTVGGTVESIHADIFQDEIMGVSEGVPGQGFSTAHTPVLTGADEAVVEVSTETGWERWQQVSNFAASGPTDKHVVIDGTVGDVLFGPAVREADGTIRQYGAVPPIESVVCMRSYATGGGRHGNVARSAIRTLRNAIPFIAEVENRYPAQGGVDGESIDQAKTRGPLFLRARSRAVTAEDYEAITREAAPETARVRCLTAGEVDVDAGSVRVLVVPTAAHEAGRLQFEDLLPLPGTLQRIAAKLDEVRLIGARVIVEPPRYQGLTIVAHIVARRDVDPETVRTSALDELYHYFNPLIGGPDGTGWPFGRDVQSGEIYSVLHRVHGVDFIEDVRLFGANPVTGERGSAVTRLALNPSSLIFSYEHHLRIEAAR